MKRLRPEKLQVQYTQHAGQDGPVIPRRYTLTHSDITGDLYLTIGTDYDWKRLSALYVRLMRDEVRAEWTVQENALTFLVHCHVSGGFVIGWARLRNAIFRRELPLVLEAFRFGDQKLFEAHPELDGAHILVAFHAKDPCFELTELWGKFSDYR